jgi:hypothetical protein
MQRRLVQFMDTSVLLELLNVPGKSSRHEAIKAELQRRVNHGVTLILPTAAIIETGNHICGLKDGYARRDRALQFDRLLRFSVQRQTPWTLHNATWDERLITALLDGAGTPMTLVQHAEVRRLGAGDLSILAERQIYVASVSTKAVQVDVWTLESALSDDAATGA